jgi:hypothetical protein
MNHSVAELFAILAINPLNGRLALDHIHFRYSLTGAILMDHLLNEEFTIENKRLIPAYRRDGDPLHDMVADRIMNSSNHRRVSFWINRLTRGNRLISKEVFKNLERKMIIRIDQKVVLKIIHYRRYRLENRGIRENLIENLRGFLIHGKQPEKRDIMLLGIVETSRAYKLISRERGEIRKMRRKNLEILKNDMMTEGINQAIREVHSAVTASVTAAMIAAHSSH